MFITADNNMKSSLTRDGSHLKYTRSYGGGGAGLITLGIILGLIGISTGFVLVTVDMPFEGLIFAAASAVLGSVFLVPGFSMKTRRMNRYMDYYMEKSGYSREMLEEFDQEFANGTVLLVSPARILSTTAKRDAGLLTDHWFQMPYMMPFNYSGLHRIEDIAAVFYELKPYMNNRSYDPLMFVINRSGDLFYSRCSDSESAGSLIQELSKRNPGMVTMRRISVNGVNYDCMTQPKDVAGLYRAACER